MHLIVLILTLSQFFLTCKSTDNGTPSNDLNIVNPKRMTQSRRKLFALTGNKRHLETKDFQTMNGANDLTLSGEINATHVHLCLTGPSDRWFGVGFGATMIGPPPTPAFIFTTGLLGAETLTVHNYHLRAPRNKNTNEGAYIDAIQIVLFQSMTVSNLRRTVKFIIPITAVPFDMTTQIIGVIFATSETPSFVLAYHGEGNCKIGEIGTSNTKSPTPSAVVMGDPHYRTIDGLRFDYDGLCTYILMQDWLTHDFKVLATNTPCALRSCVDQLKIEFKIPKNLKSHYHDKININNNLNNISQYKFLKRNDKDKIIVNLLQGPIVRVNGKTLNLTKNTLQNFDGFHISIKDHKKSGLLVEVITDIGLRVSWNGASYSSISAHTRYFGKISGLMGTFSYNLYDDLRLRNGTKLIIKPNDIQNGKIINQKLIRTFALNWMEKQENDPKDCKTDSIDSLITRNCEKNPKTHSSYRKRCSKHLHAETNYDECIKKGIKMGNWIDYCVHDLCSCLNDDIPTCLRYSAKNFHETCVALMEKSKKSGRKVKATIKN